MVIKNKIFPYPVLAEELDDYKNCMFKASVSISERNVSDTVLAFDLELTDSTLIKLISEGKATYVIHIECGTTAFRTVIKTVNNKFQYRISNKRVNSDVVLLAMIVANEDIPFYRNSNLNEDYEGMDIFIKAKSILAYDNIGIVVIEKEYEELASSESFFTLSKRVKKDDEEEQPVDYDISGDKIVISVYPETYKMYTGISLEQSMQPFVKSLIVLPALVYMLETVRDDEENDYETYKTKKWFMRLAKACSTRNIDFVTDILGNYERPIIWHAQQLTSLPIEKTFENIRMIMEGTEN